MKLYILTEVKVFDPIGYVVCNLHTRDPEIARFALNHTVVEGMSPSEPSIGAEIYRLYFSGLNEDQEAAWLELAYDLEAFVEDRANPDPFAQFIKGLDVDGLEADNS